MSEQKPLTMRQQAASGRIKLWVMGLAAVVGLLMMALLTQQAAWGTQSAAVGTPSYLPIIRKDPTPTPIPAPQFITNVSIPGAQCPNDVGINEFSGYIYVPNTESDGVSILKDDAFVSNVPTTHRSTYVESVPNSPVTYVTNQTDSLQNQISYFVGPNLTNTLPDYFEPIDVKYNPVNHLTYVSDLDSAVRVFNDQTVVADVKIPDGGWLLTMDVDLATGYVYVASWDKGMIHIIDGTTLIDSFPVGWGAYHIEIDQNSGFIYVAHSEPNAERPQNISIFHRDDHTVTAYKTAGRSYWVAVDNSGYAYFPNRDTNTVTIVKGRDLIGDVVVGNMPRRAAANTLSGYVMVTVESTNSVALFKDGQLINTMPAGKQPWAVTADNSDGSFYVANRTYYVSCNDVNQCHDVCNTPSVSVYR